MSVSFNPTDPLYLSWLIFFTGTFHDFCRRGVCDKSSSINLPISNIRSPIQSWPWTKACPSIDHLFVWGNFCQYTVMTCCVVWYRTNTMVWSKTIVTIMIFAEVPPSIYQSRIFVPLYSHGPGQNLAYQFTTFLSGGTFVRIPWQHVVLCYTGQVQPCDAGQGGPLWQGRWAGTHGTAAPGRDGNHRYVPYTPETIDMYRIPLI